MAERSIYEAPPVGTFFAISPPLRRVLVDLLAEQGWAYLRYRQLRHAMALAGPCESVLMVGAGRGLGGLALALEFPETRFTLTEQTQGKSRFDAASRLAGDLGITNVRFARLDPLRPPVHEEPHELVSSTELLQQHADATAFADSMMRLSSRFVFTLVPYASAASRADGRADERALRRHGNHVSGYDPAELMRLFPNPIAVRGCYWSDAGAELRKRAVSATPESVSDDLDALLVLGEADVRRGWPRANHEASALWILSRAGVAERRARGSFASDVLSGLRRRFGTIQVPPITRATPELSPGELLQVSGVFDADYYRSHYPDIAAKQVDPLGHFIRRGGQEGRFPNPDFDTVAYARAAKLDLQKVNPAVHSLASAAVALTAFRAPPPRLRSAVPSASSPTAPNDSNSDVAEVAGHAMGAPVARAPRAEVAMPVDVRHVPVTIVMPIFDGGDHVRRAIEAILVEPRLARASLLLIDDGSTDTALIADLGRYATIAGVSLLRNEANLGFTRTVNRGLVHALAHDTDAVLLNSDTRVGPGWLEQLILAAYASPRIATATALSDNAGAFSTPSAGENATLSQMPLERATRMSRRAAKDRSSSVPTGNGFCLYVRRDALAQVGLFDAAHFPRGYGEENDFCLRASEHGYTHVIALRAYVHHVNAVSFGSEKAARLVAAREVLHALHPDYADQTKGAFGDKTALGRQRAALAAATLAADERPLPRALYVISTQSGGTPQTNADLMRAVSHVLHPLLLSCDGRTMRIADASVNPMRPLAQHRLAAPLGMLPHTSEEYDVVIARWMRDFDVELLHIRHIAWHSLNLPRVARALGIPVVVSLHDFYCVCPSVNLTDGRGPWSKDGYANPTIVAPLWEHKHPESFEEAQAMAPRAFFVLWRRRMNDMLAAADRYVTTSHTAKDLLAGSLPVLHERDAAFAVIPHGRDFEAMARIATPPSPSEPLRILVPGNITDAKGLHTILRMVALDTKGLIELHTLGTVRAALQNDPHVKNHGSYERENFLALVREIRPHFSLIASVCPETFCHTLTESWAAGIPVIGSNLGAVGERLAAQGAGWCVDPTSAEDILALAATLRESPSEWQRAMDRVIDWQEGLGARETVRVMTVRYLDLYRGLFASRAWLANRSARADAGLAPRLAVVAAGPATTHAPEVSADALRELGLAVVRHDRTWVDASTLVRLGASLYDAVAIERGALDATVLDEVQGACARADTPCVLYDAS